MCQKIFERKHSKCRAKCCSIECSILRAKQRDSLRNKNQEYLKSRRENNKIKEYQKEYNKRPEVLKRKADLARTYKINGKFTGWKLTAWSNAVKDAWNNICAICSSNKKLEAHHIIPRSIMPEYAAVVENGICLCKECHKNIHIGLSL